MDVCCGLGGQLTDLQTVLFCSYLNSTSKEGRRISGANEHAHPTSTTALAFAGIM